MKLRDVETFKVLTSEELDQLSRASRKVKINKNEFLYTTSDVCDCLSVVLSGRLRASKMLPSGAEQIVKYLVEGEVFGEGFVFTGETYQTNIIGERSSIVMEVPLKTLIKAFENSVFLLSFLKGFSMKVYNLSNLIDVLSLRTVKQRLAKYLIELSTRCGSTTFELPFTRSCLADNLGTVREVVSRTISGLKADGIIKTDGNHVEILDIRRLERILLGV